MPPRELDPARINEAVVILSVVLSKLAAGEVAQRRLRRGQIIAPLLPKESKKYYYRARFLFSTRFELVEQRSRLEPRCGQACGPQWRREAEVDGWSSLA